MRSDVTPWRTRFAVASLLGTLVGLGACSSPKSFVVVSMVSATDQPIPKVKKVEVTVTQGTTLSTKLTYPPPSGMEDITIDQMMKNDLSVSFTGGRSGLVTLDFHVFNADECELGHGKTTAVIKMG